MTSMLHFDSLRLPKKCEDLRHEVRDFLRDEVLQGTFDPNAFETEWNQHEDFALKVSAKGWIGMTWPKKFGGQERSFLERYVVNEEMLAFNAPTQKYFTADRQSGPTLIHYASDEIKAKVLPQIIAGKACFCIGMSEPDSGSDLFASRARATRENGGWRLTGTKIWTTNAHHAEYMIGLFRTSPATAENRRHGLTSFLVDMKTSGVSCNLIGQMSGSREFNEVVFDNAFVPEAYLLGEVDGAWKQATSELAYERSGPERFMETLGCLRDLIELIGRAPGSRVEEGVGQLIAQLHSLRRMSVSVAGMLENGRQPVAEAAIVKDLGTLWEQALPQHVRRLAALCNPDVEGYSAFSSRLNHHLRLAPKLTIQGGTTEILRGVIARALGLR